LEKREGEITREIGTLNIYIAGRTHKEYRIHNAKRISEYNQNNYREYKDKVKAAYASIDSANLNFIS